MRKSFRVSLNIPDGLSIADTKEYIQDAVTSWGGQYEPPNQDNEGQGDPRFHMRSAKVTVAPIATFTREYQTHSAGS